MKYVIMATAARANWGNSRIIPNFVRFVDAVAGVGELKWDSQLPMREL